MLKKIISGGQTGADQGGLIAAFQLGVMTGGTAPAGYITSAGPNALLQLLNLKAEGDLRSRTKKNVANSDGTVVITEDAEGFLSPGSAMTIGTCQRLSKPYLHLQLPPVTSDDTQADSVYALGKSLYKFVLEHQITVLNVAGNRERHADMRITELSSFIVHAACELLDLDNRLIRDSDL